MTMTDRQEFLLAYLRELRMLLEAGYYCREEIARVTKELDIDVED
jgi:hypothetical protein